MKRIGFSIAVAALFCVPAAAMHYDVQVGIRPDARRLDATVIIRDPVSERFFLHKDFVIQSVIADGKPVAFHVDPAAKTTPFTPEAVTIVTEARGAKVLEVRYGGSMVKPIGTIEMPINNIAPEQTELAIYSSWFPIFSLTEKYTFKLTAALPQNLSTFANGKLVAQSTAQGRTTTVWTSVQPVSDMALLALPGIKRSKAGSPPVEIAYRDLPEDAAAKLRDGEAEAQKRLSALYGTPQAKTGLEIVFTPRPGMWYSRLPLMVISEVYASNDFKKESGEAQVFHNVSHELAHHWWTIATAGTFDDWINEGLAEYSALRLTQERYGEAAVKPVLAQYREDAKNSKSNDVIAETAHESADRYLNLYEKASLMFFAAREKFGDQALDAFLRDFYGRYVGTSGANTAAFLELAQQQMGPEAAAFFKEELYRHPAAGAVAQKK